MDVSVIIINYNTFQLTCNCIASVLEKTKGLQYEIIVVDNASKECDPDDFKQRFPQITLIKSGINGGFAKGNNMGIAAASGEYLLLLNSDTELLNNAVFLAWQRMVSDPTVGVLSSKLLYPDGRLQYPASRFLSLKHELREILRLNGRLPKEEQTEIYLGDRFDHLTEKYVDWVWGAFFMVPRTVLNRLPEVVKGLTAPKLPEHFFMYVEDMQWCRYIQMLGYKVLYFPAAEVVHHIGGSSKGPKLSKAKASEKVLPNQFTLLTQTEGKLYAAAFFMARIVLLLSLRSPEANAEAGAYWRVLTNTKK